MFTSKLTKLTTFMIYVGTALLSVLSFSTTYHGMAIFLDETLALIGSLGLQIALLGVAWSLMRERDRRVAYATVFAVAAMFSIFFSYANFDSTLKTQTRSNNARGEYTQAARPVLDAFSSIAKSAATNGNYQIGRLNRLVAMEKEKGWATVADEGKQDVFIQSVIDGARRTIDSWETQNGTAYPHGAGDGIISDFLQSSLAQAQEAVERIDLYITATDSTMLTLSTALPVSEQYDLVNTAWVKFPTSEIEILGGNVESLPTPPEMGAYLERATNRHEAFMLVINDLFEMDHLTGFSLALAMAIDLIVVLMAFAGSRLGEDPDYVFNRVRHHTALAVTEASLKDAGVFAETLSGNISRYRQAVSYRNDLEQVLADYKKAGMSEKKKMAAMNLRDEAEKQSGQLQPSFAPTATKLARLTHGLQRIMPKKPLSKKRPHATIEAEETNESTPQMV